MRVTLLRGAMVGRVGPEGRDLPTMAFAQYSRELAASVVPDRHES